MHAPQVSAPTQKAPSPAQAVTQASRQHPAASYAKVHYNGRVAAAAAAAPSIRIFSEIDFISSAPP